MQFYGNKTWNNATDNRDKSIIPMRENQFAEMLIFLEHSGLNFYAYVKDGSAVLAVNSSDIDKLKNVLGSQLDGLNIGKSAKPFSPPQKNIIGTIPYRNIWEREYLSYDRDTALKVAEQLEKAGIGYSGVIYSNGKATLTVNRHDQERAKEIGQTVVDMRKQYTSDVQAEKVIGNIDYKNIPDKRVMFTELTSQDYEVIRNYLDKNCEYSGLIRGGKVMFAVAAENVPKFEKVLNTILDIQSVMEELVNKGFSNEQILSLNHLISKSVDQDMELSIVSFFEPNYTLEQFAEMTEILERAADETILQRYKEDSAFSNAIDLKKRFEREADLAEIYALHPYSDEQKTAISEIYTEYFPRSLFEEMDESYTPEEWNCFLTDDNAMEWEPVARACFDEFFATGKIPYFDFYQYKGFDVYMEGYYGQNNPVMFLCYCISRFIFSFRIGVTSLYVILSAILGVLAMFWLLRECEVRHTTMLLTLFGYSCCTFFYLYGFYYFTFNNYWFIPFLLWSILKIKDTRFVWFIPGILLAFSLLLGHVQYTFYYCIVYGIVMIMLALRSRKPGLFLSAFTNAALFLALSLPNLMTQMKAGELREYVLEVFGNEFLSQPIDSFCIFVPQIAEKLWGVAQAEERSSYQLYIGMGIFSILAFVIFLPLLRSFFDDLHRWISENKKLQNFMSSVEKKSSTKELRILKYLLVSILFLLLISKVITFYFERYVSAEMYALLYILAASVCVLICVLASVLSKKDFMISFRFLKKLVILVTFSYPFLFTILAILYSCYLYKKHRIMEVSSVHSIAWGAMAAALFFVFFSMGTKTPVAMILSHIPVISGFRFLYKCGFIFIPLLFFVGAVVLDTMKLSGREIKSLSAVSIALSLISFVNLFSFFATDNHQYIRNSRLLLLPEMNAYVEQTDRLMEEQQIDRNNYRYISFADYSSYQKMDWAYYSNTVTFTRYTKNASTAIRFFSITGYDNSYSRTCFEQSDHIITKLGDFAMCQNIASPKDFFSSADEEEYKEIFEKQMIDNAVKYVIAGKYDISTQQKFEELIDRCEKLSILRKFDGLDGTMFYELDGVDQLVSTASGKQIDLDPGLSELKFTTDLDTPENITLSFTYDSRYRLALTDANGRQSFCPLTENEDGYLQAEIPEGIYSARLFYKDDMTEISMVFSLVTYILMILAYICTITRKSMKKQ